MQGDQHRRQPALLEAFAPLGAFVRQQQTQQGQIAVAAVELRGPQHPCPQHRVGRHRGPRLRVAGPQPLQRPPPGLQHDVTQTHPVGRVQSVRAQLGRVEQQMVRLGAPGRRLRHREELGQRPFRKPQTRDQQGPLLVQFGRELLLRFLVAHAHDGSQLFLVQVRGDALAPLGQPDLHLQRLAHTVGDQHGVPFGRGVQHRCPSAEEERSSGVVAGDRLQRRAGRQVYVLDVRGPAHVEVEGEGGRLSQVGAGTQEFEEAIGHMAGAYRGPATRGFSGSPERMREPARWPVRRGPGPTRTAGPGSRVSVPGRHRTGRVRGSPGAGRP